jgi:hypothetical protein
MSKAREMVFMVSIWEGDKYAVSVVPAGSGPGERATVGQNMTQWEAIKLAHALRGAWPDLYQLAVNMHAADPGASEEER